MPKKGLVPLTSVVCCIARVLFSACPSTPVTAPGYAGVCMCVCVQQHEKQVREKKRTLKQVKKSIAELVEKNSELMKELESLNVAVNERRHIHELSSGL